MGQARKGLSLLLSHMLLILPTLFVQSSYYIQQRGLDLFFFQYKMKMVTSYCCLFCGLHNSEVG